jgi:arylsulfatase
MAKNEPWQLYDLSKDRGEANDLSKAEPARFQKMQEAWEQQDQAIRALAARDLTADDLKKAATPARKKAAGKNQNRE